jgi:hypothetical protein
MRPLAALVVVPEHTLELLLRVLATPHQHLHHRVIMVEQTETLIVRILLAVVAVHLLLVLMVLLLPAALVGLERQTQLLVHP